MLKTFVAVAGTAALSDSCHSITGGSALLLGPFMSKIVSLCLCVISAGFAFADEPSAGYMLRAGEGEAVAGSLIKASPNSGTQNAVIILQSIPDQASTGLHYHLNADEFFYVISGSGTATLGNDNYVIEEGDVIFIPVGLDHEMTADRGPLVLLEFKDLPGLDEEFRVWHKRFVEGNEAMTLDKINEFAKPLGTVYKTLE
jgi:mannose-6-phosphate isomerase-like protein (cupin superfamily)